MTRPDQATDVTTIVDAVHRGAVRAGIIAGRNHDPQDLEVAVEDQPAVRAAGTAAFPVPRGGAEGAGIVADLALVRPGKLAKTTSGKIRHRRSRELLLAGELGELYRWPVPRPVAAGPAPTDPAAATLTGLLRPGTSRADAVPAELIRAGEQGQL